MGEAGGIAKPRNHRRHARRHSKSLQETPCAVGSGTRCDTISYRQVWPLPEESKTLKETPILRDGPVSPGPQRHRFPAVIGIILILGLVLLSVPVWKPLVKGKRWYIIAANVGQDSLRRLDR